MLGGSEAWVAAQYQEGDVADKFDPKLALSAAFAISSLGGLAAMLRSNKPLNFRVVVSAFLYSGMMGLIIALLWYNYFDGSGNIYFLLGVSGLAGVGGTTVLDFVLQALKHGGVNITISPGDAPPPAAGGQDERKGS